MLIDLAERRYRWIERDVHQARKVRLLAAACQRLDLLAALITNRTP